MDKVQHFEVPADDMARAKKFYGDVFGWRLIDAPMPGMEYIMAYTTEVDEKHMPKEVGAINGGIMKRGGPASGPTFAITVGDVNVSMAKVKAAGGIVLGEPMKVGEMGIYVYAKDSESNVIGLWQSLK